MKNDVPNTRLPHDIKAKSNTISAFIHKSTFRAVDNAFTFRFRRVAVSCDLVGRRLPEQNRHKPPCLVVFLVFVVSPVNTNVREGDPGPFDGRSRVLFAFVLPVVGLSGARRHVSMWPIVPLWSRLSSVVVRRDVLGFS